MGGVQRRADDLTVFPGAGHLPGVSVSEHERRWLVRRYLRTLDRGDRPTVDALVDEFVSPAYVGHFAGRELRGRESLKDYLAWVLRTFRWIQHTLLDESVDGDWVHTRALLRGEYRDRRRDPEAVGAATGWPIAYVHRVVGGRIVEAWHEGRPIFETSRDVEGG